uniref:Uncharacterized protein n=1 Tax=Arundo donax TaxID=35708 RepID=A0A0A9BBJ7_ARUDO
MARVAGGSVHAS